MTNRIEEVKKIVEQAIQADLVDGRFGADFYAREICQLFPQPLDDKELREKIKEYYNTPPRKRDCKKEHYDPFVRNPICRDCFADQILALLQPKIEEATIQARKEQMVIDWAQAGKDVEEAKRQKDIEWAKLLNGCKDGCRESIKTAREQERERIIAVINSHNSTGYPYGADFKSAILQALKGGE